MTEKSPAMPRWRGIALPVSIVLNLFLIALIGGHLLRNRSDEERFRMPLARALATAEASLPPQDAAAFGAVIRRDAPHYAEAAQQIREARLQLRLQITAEHFNQAEVKQALATWQAAWNRFMDGFGNSLVEALAHISPESRRKLVAESGAALAARTSP